MDLRSEKSYLAPHLGDEAKRPASLRVNRPVKPINLRDLRIVTCWLRARRSSTLLLDLGLQLRHKLQCYCGKGVLEPIVPAYFFSVQETSGDFHSRCNTRETIAFFFINQFPIIFFDHDKAPFLNNRFHFR